MIHPVQSLIVLMDKLTGRPTASCGRAELLCNALFIFYITIRGGRQSQVPEIIRDLINVQPKAYN